MLVSSERGLWQLGRAGEQLLCGRMRAVLTSPSFAGSVSPCRSIQLRSSCKNRAIVINAISSYDFILINDMCAEGSPCRCIIGVLIEEYSSWAWFVFVLQLKMVHYKEM